MRGIALIAALGLAACGSANEARRAAPAATTLVPAAYQGEWNRDLSACGAGHDDLRLRIGADAIDFHESSGRIRSATSGEDGILSIVADMTGEGETWTGEHRFRLSPDGQTLTDMRGGLTRQRCPSPAGREVVPPR